MEVLHLQQNKTILQSFSKFHFSSLGYCSDIKNGIFLSQLMLSSPSLLYMHSEFINDGRFEKSSDIHSALSSLLVIENKVSRNSSKTVIGFKSKNEVNIVVARYQSLLDPLTLMKEIEDLVQKWYEATMDLPDINPKRYLSYTTNQMKRQKMTVDSTDVESHVMATMAEQEQR